MASSGSESIGSSGSSERCQHVAVAVATACRRRCSDSGAESLAESDVEEDGLAVGESSAFPGSPLLTPLCAGDGKLDAPTNSSVASGRVGRRSSAAEAEVKGDGEADVGRRASNDEEANASSSAVNSALLSKADAAEEEVPSLSSWIILVCSCAQVMCSMSVTPNFSVVYREPLQLFNTDATMKAWIFNMGKSMIFVAGFLAGPLSTVYGHRIMVFGVISGFLGLMGSSIATSPYVFLFTHSVLSSMGFGFSHFSCFLNLQKCFARRRGLATGAFMASTACGKIFVPQVVEFLVEQYGYRWMMRLIAAVSLHGVVFSLIVTSREARRGQIRTRRQLSAALDKEKEIQGSEGEKTRDGNDSSSPSSSWGCGCRCCPKTTRDKFRNSIDFTVLREPAFIFLTTIDCLLGMTVGSMSWVLPFHAQERGLPPAFGAAMLSTGAACELAGRFIFPPLFDVKRLNFQYVFTGLMIAAAGAAAGIGLNPSTEVTLVLCGINGLAHAGTIGMPNMLLIKHLSIDRFPSSLSAKTIFKFLFFCLGPILGVLVDATGSYSTCLFIFSGLMLLTAGLSAIFPFVAKRYK